MALQFARVECAAINRPTIVRLIWCSGAGRFPTDYFRKRRERVWKKILELSNPASYENLARVRKSDRASRCRD